MTGSGRHIGVIALRSNLLGELNAGKLHLCCHRKSLVLRWRSLQASKKRSSEHVALRLWVCACLQFSSYVTQEDIFDGNERVAECLSFSYRLRKRIPREWGSGKRREEEHEAIQRALGLLGLEGVQHSRVGGGIRRGISGGQKRRLSLGIGEPMCFDDQPYSDVFLDRLTCH